ETLISYARAQDDPAAPPIASCLLDDLYDAWRQAIGTAGEDWPDDVATDDRSYIDRYPDELREAVAVTIARLQPREPQLLRFWQEIVQRALLQRLHVQAGRRGARRVGS